MIEWNRQESSDSIEEKYGVYPRSFFSCRCQDPQPEPGYIRAGALQERHARRAGCHAATLILAVFGGSLGTWVLDYVYDLPFLQLLNSNSLNIVIMQGLLGGIGVILTVPIAAGCSAFLLAHKRASVHETSPSQTG
ncbi:YibE/F family protein [Mitsuokella jalaludinii]|uniref:YibE/F family protein n=1 Tax=Mitsuokella jalaludinii TaxID=187979 RepID=UPI0022E1717F|nr:YibE/F family protein [Mitsuokella jalaludinii]